MEFNEAFEREKYETVAKIPDLGKANFNVMR